MAVKLLKEKIQHINMLIWMFNKQNFEVYLRKRYLSAMGYSVVYKKTPHFFQFNPYIQNDFRSECGRYAYVSISDPKKAHKYNHCWCVELDKHNP